VVRTEGGPLDGEGALLVLTGAIHIAQSPEHQTEIADGDANSRLVGLLGRRKNGQSTFVVLASAVQGAQVRLLRQPEELVFVSAKTASPTAAHGSACNTR
jgi:hypothetical protein